MNVSEWCKCRRSTYPIWLYPRLPAELAIYVSDMLPKLKAEGMCRFIYSYSGLAIKRYNGFMFMADDAEVYFGRRDDWYECSSLINVINPRTRSELSILNSLLHKNDTILYNPTGWMNIKTEIINDIKVNVCVVEEYYKEQLRSAKNVRIINKILRANSIPELKCYYVIITTWILERTQIYKNLDNVLNEIIVLRGINKKLLHTMSIKPNKKTNKRIKENDFLIKTKMEYLHEHIVKFIDYYNENFIKHHYKLNIEKKMGWFQNFEFYLNIDKKFYLDYNTMIEVTSKNITIINRVINCGLLKTD